MKSFPRFAFITTIATYFLIFIGGLVRVSGAGLGCPDWPKCFGSWIPPTSINQLPSEVDPAQFNFALAWIEYINRLCGVTVGFLILFTALWALKSFRHKPKILYPSIAATALTAFQGWQGSVVVASQLEPIVVTVHMVLALIIVSLLIYVTQEAYFSEREPGNLSQVLPKNTTVWFSVLWVLAIAQIILGTQIRSALELLKEEYPLMNSFEWLSKVGAINHIHMTLGVVLLAFTWYVGASTLKYKKQLPLLLKQSVIGMVLIASIQLILGMMFMLMEMTALMQVFHLWMASLYIGIVLLLFTISKRSQVE